jgi:hypothetical protein
MRNGMFSWTLTEAAIASATARRCVRCRTSAKPESPVNRAWAARGKLKPTAACTTHSFPRPLQ